MKVIPEMVGDIAHIGSPRRKYPSTVPGFTRKFPERDRRRPGTSRVGPFTRHYPLRDSLFGNVIPKQDALFTKYPEMLGKSVSKKGKSMAKRKKRGRKKGKRKGRRVKGLGQITTAIPRALKTTVSEDVLKGVGAGFGGVVIGRLAGGLIASRLPAATATETAKAMLHGITALVGAVGGFLIGTYLLKSKKAAEMGVASPMVVGLDGMIGEKIPKLVGFTPVSGYIDSLGQLRLPEDVQIAGQIGGLEQLRLPEDVEIAQYDEMDQVIEEEELIGEDDDSPF